MSIGVCPKCGGQLVIRTGPFGRFVGCGSFPKCKASFSVQGGDGIDVPVIHCSDRADQWIASVEKEFGEDSSIAANVAARVFAREMALAGNVLCKDLVALEGAAGAPIIHLMDYSDDFGLDQDEY